MIQHISDHTFKRLIHELGTACTICMRIRSAWALLFFKLVQSTLCTLIWNHSVTLNFCLRIDKYASWLWNSSMRRRNVGRCNSPLLLLAVSLTRSFHYLIFMACSCTHTGIYSRSLHSILIIKFTLLSLYANAPSMHLQPSKSTYAPKLLYSLNYLCFICWNLYRWLVPRRGCLFTHLVLYDTHG